MGKRTVAVDFDATLHPYTDRWVGSVPADEPPIEGTAWFLATLHNYGLRVVVYSTRADHPEGKAGIEQWLTRHDLMQYVDDITHLKIGAIAYVDDRAVPFTGDYAQALSGVMDLIDAEKERTR